MKTKATILLILSLIFISCEDLEELNEVNIPATLTQEVTIILADDSENFSESLSINLSSSIELTPFLNRIDEIEIEEAYYEFTNYEGTDEASGSVEVSSNSQVFGPFSHNFSNDFQSQTEFQLSGNTILNSLAGELKNSGVLDITVSGNQTPAQNGSLTVKMTLKIKVKSTVI